MKNIYMIILLSMSLAGCSLLSSSNSDSQPNELANLGPAPELTNTTWLNSNQPLRMADLRGKVVLLDMWTFD
jgi:hypothetical protein